MDEETEARFKCNSSKITKLKMADKTMTQGSSSSNQCSFHHQIQIPSPGPVFTLRSTLCHQRGLSPQPAASVVLTGLVTESPCPGARAPPWTGTGQGQLVPWPHPPVGEQGPGSSLGGGLSDNPQATRGDSSTSVSSSC